VTLRRYLGSLPLIPLVFVACANVGDGAGTAHDADPNDLTGAAWVLDDASIAGLVDEVPPGVQVTVMFEDGQAHGTAACNSYGGTYQAGDDGSLSFDGFAVTEMACEQPLMTVESAYLAALNDVNSFRIEGSLVLTGDGVTLTFAKESPSEPLPLVGTTWRLTTFAAADVVSSVISDTEITATFSGDDTVAGSAGCNRFSGTYASTGNTLSFSPLAATKMRCAGEVMAQESAFVDAMGAVASFSIQGTRLLLLDDDSALLLSFDGSST
jgi:heat shock protein HslJ